MTPERQAAYKQQALKSVAARANNKNAPGISMIAVTPHDLLVMLEAYEKQQAAEHGDDQQ